ncbi:MAG: hypothetical protein ABSA44_13380 [Bacteroidota bacterium]|jgi:hypothetical protein
MKNIITVLFLSGVLMGCEKDETTQPTPEKIISTSFSITDTLGNPSTVFRTGKPFYLIFQMTNKTGIDQNYTWTEPISEIYITRNDTIISRQFYGYAWPQIVRRDVLKADSSLTNRWLGPFNLLSSVAALSPGNYVADVFINARFDNAEIEHPQRIQITIIDTSQVVVMKPNIYLYPQTTRNLSIALEFPLGGSVLQSIPLYSSGWNVSVEPSGKIDRQYDYLFYESKNPDTFQYTSGWIVSRDTLTSFFSNNLFLAGFSQREKSDFIEYWIPRLVGYPYYIIYPQFADEIGKVIRLKISEQPNNMLRLFYVIQGTNDSGKMLPVPSIPQFERNGFVVTEWGVILK